MFNNYKNISEFFNSKEFKDIYHYDGELGAIYTKEKTKFILWAPTAKKVKIIFYSKNPYYIKSSTKTIRDMYRKDRGVWVLEVDEDLNGEFYNYIVNVDGSENILVDPYAKAVGVNGDIGMVIDLATTNPKNWNMDKRVKLKSPTDSIIYEAHVRDFTIDESSGVSRDLAGKYKGLISSATKVPGTKFTTALDHIKEMGFTHVHLLPVFDFASINEENLNNPQYNWGYDPKNYNVPEGSYSTNPYEGAVRIENLKK
jgi:pullulanase